MKIRIKRKAFNFGLYVLLISLSIILLFGGISLTAPNVLAGNTTNQTVITKVNVTNTEPNLYRVSFVGPFDSLGNIDLEAGNTTTIICNGSYSDPNGFEDIDFVNATFFRTTANHGDVDDNNTHYTNSTCLVSGQECLQAGNSVSNGSCTCQFVVQYFADPGNWICNMSVADSGGGGDPLADSENSSFLNVNEIVGIEVENAIINFGNISASTNSVNIRQNVTNVGNVDINVTVRGYGGDNESTGINLSMICDTNAISNISFGNMRFHTRNNSDFATMFNITNQTAQIQNLTIPQRTQDFRLGNSSNATWWQLRVPLGAGGICNGSIIFSAFDAENN